MRESEASGNRPNSIPEKKPNKFEKLLNSSIDVICSIDEEGKFIHVNNAAKNVWGYDPQELVGVKYMDLVSLKDHPKTIAVAEAIRSGTNITFFENNYIKKDGSLVPIIWSATWDEEERIMYGVAKDATEKKQLEKSLAYTQDLLDSFMNHSPIIGWITDEHGIMHYMNDSYRKTFGFTEADLVRVFSKCFQHNWLRSIIETTCGLLKNQNPLRVLKMQCFLMGRNRF